MRFSLRLPRLTGVYLPLVVKATCQYTYLTINPKPQSYYISCSLTIRANTTAFDNLFKTQTGYRDLDERITITMEKRPQLLLVLKHPELPLHNNPAELGVRQRVRKRDISLQPRSVSGLLAWDTFQSLAATCRKLGSKFYEYVRDRICQIEGQPSLSEIMQAKAIELNLGASWKPLEPRLSYKPLLLQGWLR